MTPPAVLVLAFICAFAAGNWIAVIRGTKRLEYLCKPLATVSLIGLAWTLEPVDDTMRMWFLGALALSLAGDVFLMLPRDLFVAGLGAFLLAHLAYIGGMAAYIGNLPSDDELLAGRLGAGLAIALVVLALVGLRIVLGARRRAPEMMAPVGLYILVIAAMLVVAVGTGRPAAIVGAAFFVGSDALIGWTRFVRPEMLLADRGVPGRAPLAIMVTYHVGQAGLVLSLASGGLWVLLGLMAVMVLIIITILE